MASFTGYIFYQHTYVKVAGSASHGTLVLGNGAQLWQSEPPQRAVHLYYEKNFAKVVSERLMARNISPHCYAAGQPQWRI